MSNLHSLQDRLVIVPGLRGSGPEHWQSHWQQRAPGALRVEQADWHSPDLPAWSERVAATLAAAGPCWVVAHSFGCLAAVQAVAAAPASVRGLFLAAPADPQKFGLKTLLPAGPLGLPGVVVGSLSDPWLSWGKAEYWARRWGLPLFSAGQAGHINADSGHREWQAGWRLLERLRRGAAPWQALAVAV